MKPVISVQQLGRRYELEHRPSQDSSLSWLRHPWRDRKISNSLSREEFWALRDISFDVAAGERLGIIGRNGAGKSTLLKILSRIVKPTTGKVSIRGRVSSLLEVGTGFHPELTGRENIFLNGAILGMNIRETRRKLDRIISFAEIERFLDTPVKKYSSGMYVRLAFSVAAHLEPEILIVDEVLAVGDAQFQQKCLGLMENIGQDGRTIIFVSHNMQAIRSLCNRAMVLDRGRICVNSDVDHGIAHYLNTTGATLDSMEEFNRALDNAPHDEAFSLKRVYLMQRGSSIVGDVENGLPLKIEFIYKVFLPTRGLRIYFDLITDDGVLLFRSFNDEGSNGIQTSQPGNYRATATIPADLLAPTSYRLVICSTVFNVRYCLPQEGIGIRIRVARTGQANKSYPSEPIRGKLAPFLNWVTTRLENGECSC
jgi:lipopolysaccharide transport system ATP-binding protein